MINEFITILVEGDSIEHRELTLRWDGTDESFFSLVEREYLADTGESITKNLGGGPMEVGTLAWLSEIDDTLLLVAGVGVEDSVDDVFVVAKVLEYRGPSRLVLTIDGIGEGPEDDVANLASDAVWLIRVGRGLVRVSDAGRFYEHRREIEDWQDTGIVSMRLEQLVKEEREWSPKDFSRRFGIGGSERGRLLRELGYEARTRDYAKKWVESNPS